MSNHSQMVGVFLAVDGSGVLVGVWPDGSPDRIEGTAAELRGIVLDILTGRYAPDVPPEVETRPSGVALH
jgi:hypothetical protein